MKEDDLCNGVSASVVSLIDQISTDKKLRLLWNYTPSIPGGGTALSYTPPYRLPSYPDPLDRKLEDEILRLFGDVDNLKTEFASLNRMHLVTFRELIPQQT